MALRGEGLIWLSGIGDTSALASKWADQGARNAEGSGVKGYAVPGRPDCGECVDASAEKRALNERSVGTAEV